MAGLVPAIHVLLLANPKGRRGCPAQWHVLGPAKPDPSAWHDDDISTRSALGIKPEMHDVAVGDDILLAFQPQLAGIASAGFAAKRDVIGVGDGFGADKSLFEIGMDHAGRGGRLSAAVYGPGPRLLRPDGEIGDEVQ